MAEFVNIKADGLTQIQDGDPRPNYFAVVLWNRKWCLPERLLSNPERSLSWLSEIE